MRDSVPSGSYSSICNVLRQWKSRSSLLIESTDSMILPTALTANFVEFPFFTHCGAESILESHLKKALQMLAWSLRERARVTNWYIEN